MTLQFTGKDREVETGLDYFGVRYYSGAQGRFSSPDPLLDSCRPWEPQSWNRFAYALNNPLRFTDPTGLYEWATGCASMDTRCEQNRQKFRDAIANRTKAAGNLQEGSNERKQLDKTIKRIGDEGKGKGQVAFGDAGTDAKGNPNAGMALGNKITLNLDAVAELGSSWGRSLGYDAEQTASLTSDIMTGLVGHEGGHLAASGLLGISLVMRTERTALYSESATYQGLHYTDLLYKLWNESWAKVDVTTREEFRNQGIQTELDRQKGKEFPK